MWVMSRWRALMTVKNILFVCTGNICRSPMAEGLFRHLVADRKDVRVASAGVHASPGQPPSTYSVEALAEIGIDISRQRSQSLTDDLVARADLIFAMTRGHLEA